MTVRAKFLCTADETTVGYGTTPGEKALIHKYRFSPQYQPEVPEDERYAKYTPSGELWMQVDNPAVTFDVGTQYYLDFTPVPQEGS